jgi:hypothetical protein
MDPINYYGLRSKLNLYKIDHEIDEEKGVLTVGNHRMSMPRILLGIACIVLAIVLFIVMVTVLEVVSRF